MWDLIVSVPDHYLSFYYLYWLGFTSLLHSTEDLTRVVNIGLALEVYYIQ